MIDVLTKTGEQGVLTATGSPPALTARSRKQQNVRVEASSPSYTHPGMFKSVIADKGITISTIEVADRSVEVCRYRTNTSFARQPVALLSLSASLVCVYVCVSLVFLYLMS